MPATIVDAVNASPSVSDFNTSELEYLPYTSGQFTTAAVSITGPVGLRPVDVTETFATVAWNSAGDNAYPITGYDLQYRQDGSSTWISGGFTTSTGASFTGLTPGTSYDVEVDAVDSAGNTGSWLNATNLFTMATLPAPTLTAPADQAIGQSTTPTLSWDPVSGAVGGYNIIVDTSAADLPRNPAGSAGSAGPTAVQSGHLNTNTDMASGALQNGTTYYWEVQGLGSGGARGGWSAIESFTAGTLSAPTVISPANQSTGLPTTPVFAWNPVTGAAGGYNVIVDTSASDLPTSLAGTAGATAVFSGNTAVTTAMPGSPLEPSTIYYWEVQAVASGGVPGAWSPIESFTTTGPRLTVFLNGEMIQPGQGIAAAGGATDFGSVVRGHVSSPQTFTVENTGNSDLTLGRLSVPDGFAIVLEPPRLLKPGHIGAFKVRLKTTEVGSFGGAVSFASNDPAAGEDPFTFTIAGTVIPKPSPSMTVLGDGQAIQSGRLSPTSANGTDFGAATLGGAAIENTFTIQNTGNATLTISAIKVPPGFTVIARPPRSIAPGGSATFTLRLNTRKIGTFVGLVRVLDNDPHVGQDPFTLAITGIVMPVSQGGG
jgi:hypothetical protein